MKYGDHVVGKARITATNIKVEPYEFHIRVPQKEIKKHFEVNATWVVLAIVGVIVLILLVVLIIYFINHFYIIRYRIKSRRKQKNRFKVIKSGKHSKWKTRW